MKPEEKKTLGQLINKHRHRLNWTQERLAGAADVNLRTVQRAEGGFGINSENLGALAAALGLDESKLRTQAATAGPPPPEKRVSLKQLKSAQDLIHTLQLCKKRGWSLELGPPDEHPYNEMVGEDMIELDEDLEHPPKSKQDRVSRLRCAHAILSMCRKMGFGLFAGNYIEEVKIKNHYQRRKATLIIAAPQTDPRIVRTQSGMELDIVRDSRRLLLGGMLSGHATTYDWLEHQLISKSDGEERVKDVFRKIMAEVLSELNQIDEKEKKNEDIQMSSLRQ